MDKLVNEPGTLPEGIEQKILKLTPDPELPMTVTGWMMRSLMREMAAEGAAQERAHLKAFVHWHKTTPNASLFGDSRVAFDAQSRILDQLLCFMEGTDDYLNAAVELATRTPPPPDKCRACNGTGGGENRMGGPEWTCSVCKGTGRMPPPPEAQK